MFRELVKQNTDNCDQEIYKKHFFAEKFISVLILKVQFFDGSCHLFIGYGIVDPCMSDPI